MRVALLCAVAALAATPRVAAADAPGDIVVEIPGERSTQNLVLVACSPDIASGTYFCGPEEACPSNQVCSPANNTCVLPSTTQPFACETANVTGDDSPGAGQAIAGLGCVSLPNVVIGCLPEG